jgi:DNA-binding PadR family transcriptional regulator
MSLRYALLGLLTEKPMSGYDLAKTIEGSEDIFWKASTSQIYRELAKLAADNLVEVEIQQQEGRPNKKVYNSTEMGRATFRTWLLESSEANIYRVEFLIRAFFFDRLPAEDAVEIILEWKKQHEEKLTELQDYISGAIDTEGYLRPGKLAIFTFGAGYYTWVIEWCDRAVDLMLHPDKAPEYTKSLINSHLPDYKSK